MDKLKAIKERHSVRKYLKKEIEQEKVDRLNAEIDSINQESGLSIQFVTNEDTCFGGIMSYGKFENVSNYIALIGKKTRKLDEMVGYFGSTVRA